MDRRLLLACALLISAQPMAARAAEGDEKKKKTGGASYLALNTLTATLMRPNGSRGVLTVEVGLDAPDPAQRAFAEKIAPRIRAQLVQSVQKYAASYAGAAAPNVDYLSKELQRQTDLGMGKLGVRLLLGTVMVN